MLFSFYTIFAIFRDNNFCQLSRVFLKYLLLLARTQPSKKNIEGGNVLNVAFFGRTESLLSPYRSNLANYMRKSRESGQDIARECARAVI